MDSEKARVLREHLVDLITENAGYVDGDPSDDVLYIDGAVSIADLQKYVCELIEEERKK